MHLVRLSITKEALADRTAVHCALSTMVDAETRDSAMPAARGTTDAVRTAASYALQRWQRFEHAGQTCKAIAKATKGAKKRGLDLHIHVQATGDTSVSYSALVARLTSKTASDTPFLYAEDGAAVFPAIVKALDPHMLREHGQAHLYDNDLRKICDALLDPYAVSMWPGVSLVLTDEGVTFAHALERVLAPCLRAGSLSVSLIALDMSHANREALARDLAREWTPQLANLAERCGYTAPNVPAITREYETLAAKISQAEALLGVDVPCLEAQLTVEAALMALPEKE